MLSTIRGLRSRALRTVLTPACLAAVPLRYETTPPPGGHGELDTPAVWIAPNPAQSLLLVTDKTWDYVEFHSPVTNQYLGRCGGSGSTPGRLDRPNAVLVAYGVPTGAGPRDAFFVVERDNSRITAFALPMGHFLGTFGSADLQEPMGIALHWNAGTPQLWITDVGTAPQRIVVFDVVASPTGLTGIKSAVHVMGPAAVLESIAIDSVNQRVYVCDEGAYDLMVLDLQGAMLGRFGTGRFSGDPEGIAIYDTGNGSGYVIVTDQEAAPVQWEVFDRQDNRWLLNFFGSSMLTDGITLTQAALPNLPQGSFFAAHEDRAVHAYDWSDIAAATTLCVGGPCAPVDAGSASDARRLGFPTPFRGSGSFTFRLDAPGCVALDVFDLRGRRVSALFAGTRAAGAHRVAWDGRADDGTPLPSGVYFLRAQLPGSERSHKITLVR